MIIPTIMCLDKDLFGNETTPPDQIKVENRAAVIAHKKLILLHREMPDKRCKACDNLIRKKNCGTSYFKCALFKNTNGPATDWRVNWNACGKFIETKSKTK